MYPRRLQTPYIPARQDFYRILCAYLVQSGPSWRVGFTRLDYSELRASRPSRRIIFRAPKTYVATDDVACATSRLCPYTVRTLLRTRWRLSLRRYWIIYFRAFSFPYSDRVIYIFLDVRAGAGDAHVSSWSIQLTELHHERRCPSLGRASGAA